MNGYELFGVLFTTGLVSGAIGSMVGLGGGFLVVPILRVGFGLDPAIAAGTSLAMVFANSASGSAVYLAQRRVRVRVALIVSSAGFIGSILGALVVSRIPALLFDWLLAVFLLGVAVDIAFNRRHHTARVESMERAPARGQIPRYLGIGFVVGFISSLFGLGGGVVLVPALLYFSDLPAHAISATSQFGIFLTSPVGLATHVIVHDIRTSFVIPLVLGGLCGGPIGARFSTRLKSVHLLRAVGIALAVVAITILARHML